MPTAATPASTTRAAWSGTWRPRSAQPGTPPPERRGARGGSVTGLPAGPSSDGVSPAARQRLLARARAAIAAQIGGAPLGEEDLGDLRAELEWRSGAFVTLARRGNGEL